ncbi:unnamed protein product [marine sediment metagenome]|uniref:Glutamine amidotransferase domain-containing protein n=1 Tax=marine sediment metagenome TaxID=412755 RepID=X1FU75_9ZZZZ
MNSRNYFINDSLFLGNESFVKKAGIPGCIAHRMQRMKIPSRDNRIISISLKKTDELIPYSKNPVNIHQRDYISPDGSNIQKNFDIIATSEINGFKAIQYMRHIKRTIFSVQFHPETHNINYNYSGIYDKKIINKTMTIGEEIINNFVLFCNQ